MQRYELFFYYANILIKNFNQKLIFDLNQLIILFLFFKKIFSFNSKIILFVCVHYILYIIAFLSRLFKNCIKLQKWDGKGICEEGEKLISLIDRWFKELFEIIKVYSM